MKRRAFKLKQVAPSLQRDELLEIRESLRGVRDLLETIQSTQTQLNKSIDVISRLDMFVEVGLVRLDQVTKFRTERRQYRKRKKAA